MTHGCGRRCNRPAAAPGAVACTMWMRLWRGWTAPDRSRTRKRAATMRRGRRSTPAGQHRPVLLSEVLATLAPQPGEVVADCTVGWGGHAVELLPRVGPEGRLIGI